MITLYDHPLSPYGQKVKIAMREKGVAFETVSPGGLGAGGAAGAFAEANPRAEVPTLTDGGVSVFDSTVILEYLRTPIRRLRYCRSPPPTAPGCG
ncbi:glutathione S-transferase N-terminal domain-containing protein [Phenylobacterium sp.]|uniref:glutathione S-transferase family protein n=1 Tax=Phenylobacterium sp. TaxID=1871053 RepID=UPI002E35CE1F|nr:glutathione S-transferase N-terminal domain-containing protein [Phenylobacterium sp.]HEX4713022.1 glutathione S-transferase N-terminal domain-containing protein [Phenylobacterium sp.]